MLIVRLEAGQARDAIHRAILSLKDMEPVYSSISQVLVDSHRQRFIDGKDPQGKPWAPKSAATLERYRRMGYGRLYKPLWGHTGLLKETIVSYVSKDGVIIGSPMIYSGVMQFGAKRGQFGATKRGSQ